MAPAPTALDKIAEIVKRVRRQTGRYDVTIAVDEPILIGNPYVVTMSKDRLVHRIMLDWHSVQRFMHGGNDALLVREIRLGFAALDRLMRVREMGTKPRTPPKGGGPAF